MDRTNISKPPTVTFHVGDSGQAAAVHARTDRDVSVREPKPPRAAEARPAQSAKPARSIDGRLSILSLRSFARLAACLVGVFHRVNAETHVGLAPATFPHAELDEPAGGLDDAVGLLSALGVEVFYVAQGGEGDQASLSSINAVLHGLVGQLGSGHLLQQDVARLSNARRTNPSVAEFDKAISKNADQIGDDPHARFADLLSSSLIKPFAFSRRSGELANVIDGAPIGTVVGLSKDLAFYLHAGPNAMRFPGRKETVPLRKAHEIAEPQLGKQNDLYGLFQASSSIRPTALIVTSQTVPPAEVEELWEHFKGEFAVCMVPLEDDVQAMIVAPLAARSELVGLVDELADRGVGPTKRPPAATLEQWMQENKPFLEGGVAAIPGLGDDPVDLDVEPASESPESARLSVLGQMMGENGFILGASAIAGLCVLVYRCSRSSLRDNQDPGGQTDSAATKSAARATRRSRQSPDRGQSHQLDEGRTVPVERTPASYSGTPGRAFVPSLPEDIAASITQSIRDMQADKENGKAELKRYLRQKGVELRALLDPGTDRGAEAAANVAFQLSGIIESTLMNQTQMRRWLEGEDFLDGVNFDSVLQTVKDHKQLEPQNEMLAKAIAMLQGYSRLVPRGDSDEREFKGRQGPAQGPGPAHARSTRANAASANNGAAMPSPVTIANIFAFGKELAAEVARGGDMNGVRIGKDIYIPSAVIVPHWHLNENFVVYKHSDTNHIEVARGANFYPERAGSVGMRLDDTNARDHQLLRIQTFILTGNKIA
jgi:hypothetical protein